MHPATRTQVDGLGDAVSAATGKVFDPAEDMARQEFREESDVNYQLSRYGVDVPLRRNPQFGEVDWDLDLHGAHIAFHNAQFAFVQLPEELRQRFRTPSEMLDAMNSGELALALMEHRDKQKQSDPKESDPANPEPSAGENE